MKEVRIDDLTIEHFRKTRFANYPINQQNVRFTGQNGAGKSTVGDSISWALTGKNLAGLVDFGIKTLVDGEPIPQIDHKVTMRVVLYEDGVPTTATLERNYREVWAGSYGGDPRMTGHTTEYKINGLGSTMTEYNKYVGSLGDLAHLADLTRPEYFAKTRDWKERRAVLFSMVSNLTDDDVAGNDQDLIDLLTESRRVGVSMEQFKKWLQDHISPLEKQVSEIPTRIDEARKQTRPLPSTSGWRTRDEISEDINRTRNAMTGDADDELQKLKISAREAALAVSTHESEHRALVAASDQSEAYRTELNQWNSDRAAEDQKITQIQLRIRQSVSDIERIIDQKAQHQATADAISSSEWTGSTSCSACTQPLPADQIESARHTFNLNKSKQLQAIAVKLSELEAEEQEAIKHKNVAEVALTQAQTEKGQAPVRPVAPPRPVYNPSEDVKWVELNEIKRRIELDIARTEKDRSLVVASMAAQLNELEAELRQWTDLQRATETNASVESRVKDLQQEQVDANIQANAYRRYLAIIPKWIEAKASLAEETINSKFALVRWKLHQKLVNGSQEECCIPTIDGVPFEDRSDGEQINAGLDIIEALGLHYGCRWPIIIDRAESVHPIYPTTAQQIQLCMTPNQSEVQFVRL
jgi:hypothetical protein